MGDAFVIPPVTQQIPYRIEKLNPLAFPKGQSLSCDLSGKPAMVSLVTSYTTLHFASKELAKVAWDGILCKMVHVMGNVLGWQGGARAGGVAALRLTGPRPRRHWSFGWLQ